MTGDDEVQQLLSVPLSAFVEERKRLAAALKAAGRPAEARELAKLAKPSAALWVVNQLASKEAALLKRFGELTAALRSGPAAADYTRLLGEHRDALRALRAAAERILVESGHGAPPALLERIAHNLRAGMASDDTRAAIEARRLLREVGELDFATLVGAPGDGAPRGPGAGNDEGGPAPARRHDSGARAPATAHHPGAHGGTTGESPPDRAQTAAQRHAAEQATRERARALAAAERAVEKLRPQATAARQKMADEERALETARRALAQVEARVAAARAAAGTVAVELEAAESALARARQPG